MNKFASISDLLSSFNIKILFIFVLLAFLNTLQAQVAPEDDASKDIQKENMEEDLYEYDELENEYSNVDLPRFPIVISKFRIIPKYYGLPISIKFGYFYRRNDFSIFPNIALNLVREDTLIANASSGIVLQKNFFTWQVDAFYEMLPFTMNKAPNEQVAYSANVFSFRLNKTKLSLISIFGNKRKILAKTLQTSTDLEFAQGIRLDAFLLDNGFFKSTLDFSFFVDWRPSSNFIDYRLSLNVPATFNLYFIDIAFMYSFYSTGCLNSKDFPAKENYIIEREQSVVTGRDSFKKEERYSILQLFGLETRWYVTRTQDRGAIIKKSNNDNLDYSLYNKTAKTNGFFLSLFGDIGFGITRENKYKLIGECGLGFGYTLFDCVPFTFQVGLNQRFEPVFFLSVVSRITHLP